MGDSMRSRMDGPAEPRTGLFAVTKRFGATTVFSEFTMPVRRGVTTSVLGPSGCGKTTLLRLLSGLLDPDSGAVEGVGQGPHGFVFQDPCLLPWRTVRENIRFVVPRQKSDRTRDFIDALLRDVGLLAWAESLPSELSGGMRRRVALARAFALDTEFVFLDEPFQGLDVPLKLEIVSVFNALRSSRRPTVVFVTHDIPDAALMGEEIVVLSGAPTAVSECFSCLTDPGERSPDDPEVLELSARLYRSVLGSSRGGE